MKKILFSLLLFVCASVWAQPVSVTANRLRGATSAPTGTCQSFEIRMLANGTLYTCQSGTWAELVSGSSLPVADSTAVVKGSSDATKLLRFEVDGFTTGTTRTLTSQNASYTLAGIDLAQTFSTDQTFSAQILAKNGTAGSPGIGFSSNPTTGFRQVANVIVAVNNGGDNFEFAGNSLLTLYSDQSRIRMGASNDVGLGRNAARVLEVNNGNAGQFGDLKLRQLSPLTNAAGNSGAALTIDWNNGTSQTVTLTGNCTFTFSNPIDNASYFLALAQDGTGSRTVTWPAAVLWAGGTAPVLTTTASAVDIVSCKYLSSTSKYYCSAGFDFR